MFSFNGPAAAYVLTAIIAIAVIMFALSPADTMKGTGEFIDARALRNFKRSLMRFRPRFSMATLIIWFAFLPPCIAVVYRYPSYVFTPEGVPILVAGIAFIGLVLKEASEPNCLRCYRKKHLPSELEVANPIRCISSSGSGRIILTKCDIERESSGA